jgi:hypothetical protein
MTDAAFPSNIAVALDRLTVPSLPSGFAERLLARIEAGDLPVEAEIAPPLPAMRKPVRTTRGWVRSGRIIGSVALFGLATATAAASGFFGEPVYVPVVSDALAKAELVELPKPKPPVAKPEKIRPPEVVETLPKAPPTGKAAVHDLLDRLKKDESYNALPPRERVAVARREAAKLIRSGTVTRPEMLAALAEIRGELRPEIRAKVDAEVQRRRDAGLLPPKPKAKAGDTEQPAVRPVPRKTPAERREAWQQLDPADQARIRELNQRLRMALPEERPAIRREIRRVWQAAQAEAAPAENNAPESEGNPEPPR